MKFIVLFSTTLLVLPTLVHAQGIQTFFGNLVTFINRSVIPLFIGIAFLIFIINVIRFFVIEGGNEDSKEKARSLALYGILAFVLLVVFWGVVNVLASSIGLDRGQAGTPDYIQSGNSSRGTSPSGTPPTPPSSNPSSPSSPPSNSNQPSSPPSNSNQPSSPPPFDPELEGIPCELRLEGC